MENQNLSRFERILQFSNAGGEARTLEGLSHRVLSPAHLTTLEPLPLYAFYTKGLQSTPKLMFCLCTYTKKLFTQFYNYSSLTFFDCLKMASFWEDFLGPVNLLNPQSLKIYWFLILIFLLFSFLQYQLIFQIIETLIHLNLQLKNHMILLLLHLNLNYQKD